MIMKSKKKKYFQGKQKYSTLFFYRFETNIRHSTQASEPTPTRESIHSETILNVYPVDSSTILTGSQDRVLKKIFLSNS